MRYIEFLGAEQLAAGRPYLHFRVRRDCPVVNQQIHWNQYPEVLQVMDGSIVLSINCQRYTMQTGDVLYLSADTMYAVEKWDGEADFIEFNSSQLEELSVARVLLEGHRTPYLCLRDDGKELIANLHNLFASMLISERYFESSAADLRRILLAYSDGDYTLVQPETPPHSHKQLNYLRTVLEEIDAHLYEQMTLDQLADSVGLSAKYFCRFFQSMTGQKPFEYINNLRIEHACDIFTHKKATVKEVAAQLGYKDINYFIKTFKRYRGMTPKKFAIRYYHYMDYLPQYDVASAVQSAGGI
jgi:AraC-like DNA-binding protein